MEIEKKKTKHEKEKRKFFHKHLNQIANIQTHQATTKLNAHKCK